MYELCIMDKATQKSKQNGQDVHLGEFSKWSAQKKDSIYSYQIYERGLGCWNGPSRSVALELICGVDMKLISVSEPSKCEYIMKLECPAACPIPNDDSTTEIYSEL